jgi:putative transposase
MRAKNTLKREYQGNRHGVYSCKYHIVWCPKVRRKVLVEGVDHRLKEVIQQTAAGFEATLIELEVTPALACGASVPDHVHLLGGVDPQFGVHRLVGHLKGRSLRQLRQECSRLPTLWTRSYFVATIGGAPLSMLKQYIGNQKNI